MFMCNNVSRWENFRRAGWLRLQREDTDGLRRFSQTGAFVRDMNIGDTHTIIIL